MNDGVDSRLSDKQSLRHRIADAETKFYMARPSIRDAASNEARVPEELEPLTHFGDPNRDRRAIADGTLAVGPFRSFLFVAPTVCHSHGTIG